MDYLLSGSLSLSPSLFATRVEVLFCTYRRPYANPYYYNFSDRLAANLKAYVLVSVCSWSTAVLFAPLLSLTASEILQVLEVCMTSVGRTMPVKVYSDSAPSFISLNESRQGVETSPMSDEEYLDLQRKINEQGIKLVNHCAYAPNKTGRVERKVASLKVLLRAWA